MSAVHSTARRSGLRAAVAGSVAAKTVELLTLVLLATVVPRTLGPAAGVTGALVAILLSAAAASVLTIASGVGATGVLALSFT